MENEQDIKKRYNAITLQLDDAITDLFYKYTVKGTMPPWKDIIHVCELDAQQSLLLAVLNEIPSLTFMSDVEC